MQTPFSAFFNQQDIWVGLEDFFTNFWWTSYWGWAYRIHTRIDAESLNQVLSSFFTEYSWRLHVFWSIWNWVILALTDIRNTNSILLFEPETWDVFEIPGNLSHFHNSELFMNQEAIMRLELFNQWLVSWGAQPTNSECIWYKQPLFLWGSDSIDNLELTDLEVYLSLTGQIWNAVKNLPEWTQIGNVNIG